MKLNKVMCSRFKLSVHVIFNGLSEMAQQSLAQSWQLITCQKDRKLIEDIRHSPKARSSSLHNIFIPNPDPSFTPYKYICGFCFFKSTTLMDMTQCWLQKSVVIFHSTGTLGVKMVYGLFPFGWPMAFPPPTHYDHVTRIIFFSIYTFFRFGNNAYWRSWYFSKLYFFLIKNYFL